MTRSARYCLVLFLFCLTIKLQAQWVQKASFTGSRACSVSWTIGNKFYVVGGCGFGDLQEYDPVTNTWRSRAPIPQGVTQLAAGFVINGKGYLCGGTTAGFSYHSTFLEYDPVADTWTTKAPLPTGNRASAVGFSIGNKGYICCGDNGVIWSLPDVHEYDPATDSWSVKTPFAGGDRATLYAFSVGNKGYVGGGFETSEEHDLWEFDPLANTWTPKAQVPGNGRQGAVFFASGSHGYVGLGTVGFTTFFNDLYKYDPLSNTWDTLPAFTPGGRGLPLGFDLGDSIYISSGMDFNNSYNDLYVYRKPKPVDHTGLKDNNSERFTIYPNPATENIYVTFPEKTSAQIELFDVMGKVETRSVVNSSGTIIPVAHLPKGVYFINVLQGNSSIIKKIIH